MISLSSGADEADLASADIVFAALPHGASAEWVAKVIAAGARVVDLSSDLRPGHGGVTHALPDGVPSDAPYGLPELFRASIEGARVVANPGGATPPASWSRWRRLPTRA